MDGAYQASFLFACDMRPERDQSPLAFGMEEAFGDQLALLVVSEVK